MQWGYKQMRFIPRSNSWTGEIEELWIDHRHPELTLVGLMNEPLHRLHSGCYTFKRPK